MFDFNFFPLGNVVVAIVVILNSRADYNRTAYTENQKQLARAWGPEPTAKQKACCCWFKSYMCL